MRFRITYIISLSHSPQIFWPDGNPADGATGLVSGAWTCLVTGLCACACACTDWYSKGLDIRLWVISFWINLYYTKISIFQDGFVYVSYIFHYQIYAISHFEITKLAGL